MSNIAGFYTHDHHAMDEHFHSFQKLKTKNYPQAKDHFRRFMVSLKRHILCEEQILFPLFEEKTGIKDGGPTEIMRLEHAQILDVLNALHAKVRAQDPNTDLEETLLSSLLKVHNDKEEHVLYPAIDRLATAAEKKKVFEYMDNIPVGVDDCGGCCCA